MLLQTRLNQKDHLIEITKSRRLLAILQVPFVHSSSELW